MMRSLGQDEHTALAKREEVAMLTTETKPPVPAQALRAHALKNCLAVVSAVNRLVESEVSEFTQDRLLRSQSAVHRMRELIDQELLAYAEPLPRPDLELVSVEEVLDAVRVRAEDLAAVSRVELLFRIGTGSLRGDVNALAEALGNLVTNAIESTSSGGAVIVTSSESADGGQVWTVRDTGPGIPPQLMPSVGVPFFSRRAGGSGLGVAIARDIVAQHGGSVCIESLLGSGTTVSIWLPPTA
jgi:signal transduction histidine kinase